MKVFKFGGASVKNADAVRNLAQVVKAHEEDVLIIVVSAMGKTTNAMESLLDTWTEKGAWPEALEALRSSHLSILNEVAADDNGDALLASFASLKAWLTDHIPGNYDHDYDQVVGYGEMWSTMIVAAHLNAAGLNSEWLDARKVVRTDNTFRTARVNWQESQVAFDACVDLGRSRRFVTQGFIASSENGSSTTLGREGSDFSAAVFAYLGDGESVTIWKDVEGMFNADPRKFDDTILLERISYREAIELSYFGASVIHPRTVKPLQNKQIPLYIRSFLNLDKRGSLISASTQNDSLVPSFISKADQVLISITPRDFSFIVEEHMAEIFGIFAKHRVKIELIQNSALAFTVVFDDLRKLANLKADLDVNYGVRYNEGLELLTVRHYDEATLEKLTGDRKILLEQRSRSTARFVLA